MLVATRRALFGARSPLSNGLVAFWKMEEASGARADVSGNNLHLTANNAPGNTPAKIGNGAALVLASNQYLSRPDETLLRPFRPGVVGYTIAGWIMLTDFAPATQTIATKFNGGANSEFILWRTSAQFQWNGYEGVGGTRVVQAFVSTASLAAGTPYFLCARWDGALGFDISVNDTLLTGSGVVSGTLNSTAFAAPLFLGTQDGASNSMGGWLDAWGIWNRKITDAERTLLYNGGAGKEYPF